MGAFLLRLRFRWVVSRRVKRIGAACMQAKTSVTDGIIIFAPNGAIRAGATRKFNDGWVIYFPHQRPCGYFLIPIDYLLDIYSHLDELESNATCLTPAIDTQNQEIREALGKSSTLSPNNLLRPIE